MSITIDTFKANFDTGARANLFDVQLSSPADLGWQFEAGDMLRCRSVDMEGSSLGTNTRDQYNSGYDIPDGTVDQGGFVDISFICDQSFHDRALIEAWHQWIYTAPYKFQDGPSAAGTQGSAQIPVMKYLDEYIGEMVVYALRKDETQSMKYTYHDVYPSSFDTMSFGATEEGILEIKASFQYRHWDSEYLVQEKKPNRNFTEYYDKLKSQQPEIKTINRGREILDGTLNALKVGSRFNKKSGDYLNKLSSLDSSYNQYRNIFGGG
jgi:hypothetical protein